jgi:hypothetical protein
MRMIIRRAYETGFLRHYVTASMSNKGFFASLGFMIPDEYSKDVENNNNTLFRMERVGDITGRC